MNKHKGCKRGFTQLSKAWYAKTALGNLDVIDKFTVGHYAKGGGASGEFEVKWSFLGWKGVPQLTVFDDSWSSLLHFKDLLEEMAKVDGKNVSPDDFREILIGLGIEDLTKTKMD